MSECYRLGPGPSDVVAVTPLSARVEFGSSGGTCEETVRACCGLLTAKTLPDCLPLHLLRPAVI